MRAFIQLAALLLIAIAVPAQAGVVVVDAIGTGA